MSKSHTDPYGFPYDQDLLDMLDTADVPIGSDELVLISFTHDELMSLRDYLLKPEGTPQIVTQLIDFARELEEGIE